MVSQGRPRPRSRWWFRASALVALAVALVADLDRFDGPWRVWLMLGGLLLVMVLWGRGIWQDRDRTRTPY